MVGKMVVMKVVKKADWMVVQMAVQMVAKTVERMAGKMVVM